MSTALLVSLVLTGSASAPRESSVLEDVLVAAFRQQIAEVLAARSAQFAADPIICVGTTVGAGDRDPEEPIMKRLAVDPSVRPVSLCVVDEGLAREKSSGREAVILKSGSVEWLSDDRGARRDELLPLQALQHDADTPGGEGTARLDRSRPDMETERSVVLND